MGTIEEIFEEMRDNPGLYLHDNQNVEMLVPFIDGFFSAKLSFADLTDFEKVFCGEFGNFIDDKYNQDIDWANMSWEDVRNTKMTEWYYVITVNAKDERASLDLFFELFDEFHKMYDNGDFAGVLRE